MFSRSRRRGRIIFFVSTDTAYCQEQKREDNGQFMGGDIESSPSSVATDPEVIAAVVEFLGHFYSGSSIKVFIGKTSGWVYCVWT